MGRRKRFPDRRQKTVVLNNCWLPMKDFSKIKREVEQFRKSDFVLRYFVMVNGGGHIVCNWYVSKQSGWFFGNPKDFVAWAEIERPTE